MRINAAKITVRVLACVVIGTAFFGHAHTQEFYSWNSRNQPSVSINEALRKAQHAVGDDYYCTFARLYGNKSGTTEDGRWSLDFGSKDGSAKTVQVDAAGEVRIDSYLHPTPKRLKAISTLAEVRAVFEEFLKGQNLQGDVTSGESVTMSVGSRTYHVHQMLETGEWSTDTSRVVGPKADGFVVRASVDTPLRQRAIVAEGYAVYWLRAENVFRMKDGKHSLVIEIDYGPNVSQPLIRRLFELFTVAGTGTE